MLIKEGYNVSQNYVQHLKKNGLVIITYIHTLHDGWSYLASNMNLNTKKIVGYSFSCSMATDSIIKVLEKANNAQKLNEGLISHSDLGIQFTSTEFSEVTEKFKMTHSFSYKENPYGNDYIESFHSFFKKKK